MADSLMDDIIDDDIPPAFVKLIRDLEDTLYTEAALFEKLKKVFTGSTLEAILTAYKVNRASMCSAMEGLKRETSERIMAVINSRGDELRAHDTALQATKGAGKWWTRLSSWASGGTIFVAIGLAYFLADWADLYRLQNESQHEDDHAEQELDRLGNVVDQIPSDSPTLIGPAALGGPGTD